MDTARPAPAEGVVALAGPAPGDVLDRVEQDLARSGREFLQVKTSGSSRPSPEYAALTMAETRGPVPPTSETS